MTRHSAILPVADLFVLAVTPARADDQDAKAILDKAIKALGGEEKLTKASRALLESQGHTAHRRRGARRREPRHGERPRPFSPRDQLTSVSVHRHPGHRRRKRLAKGQRRNHRARRWQPCQRETQRVPATHPGHPHASEGQRLQVRGSRRGKSQRQTGRHSQGHGARRQGLQAVFRQGKRPPGQGGRHDDQPRRTGILR